MEWVLVALVLAEAPNFSQSHSYYIPLFQSEKLCDDARSEMKSEFSKATDGSIKITVRTSCFPRKPNKEAK